MSMTPEQKQIAIAEFEGWKELRDGRWKLGETGIVERFLPPYLTYRDAICGAVARLDEKQRRMFTNMLYDIQLGCYDHSCWYPRTITLAVDDVANLILATPSQLADALLLTLGYEI